MSSAWCSSQASASCAGVTSTLDRERAQRREAVAVDGQVLAAEARVVGAEVAGVDLVGRARQEAARRAATTAPNPIPSSFSTGSSSRSGSSGPQRVLALDGGERVDLVRGDDLQESRPPLVGREPAPRRPRAALGTGERERRGDARAGRRTAPPIAFVPASMTEFYARPDLVWVPISDVDPLRIALAWRERDASPLVAAFAAVVREIAEASVARPGADRLRVSDCRALKEGSGRGAPFGSSRRHDHPRAREQS